MELSKVTLEIFTKLEQKWLSHCESTTKKVRILSIDGGGTSGIVSGAALIHLEDQILFKTGDHHAQIADFFDMIAGTGVGALIAATLSADDGTGHPIFSAREAVKFITQNNSKLFKVNRLARVLHRRKRFSGKSMDKVLKEMFKREDGTVLTLKDMLCRATSATPSLFKRFPLASVDGKTSCSAVDGGLVMNNPTAAAITHVLHNKRDFPLVNGVEDLLVLSLGNGPSLCGKSKVSNNGECSTSSVVDIVLEGVSETVDQMLGNAFCWNRANYVRFSKRTGE
ncbi:Patatin group A-3 [Gossypium arboreum]|uniref:Patatin n=1 Tax=Gossypium arboreum TaxID=29729 RepID=A0A0B0MM70_GOSAR|nr:Patatin group A-3 [Gossypium arboreum]